MSTKKAADSAPSAELGRIGEALERIAYALETYEIGGVPAVPATEKSYDAVAKRAKLYAGRRKVA